MSFGIDDPRETFEAEVLQELAALRAERDALLTELKNKLPALVVTHDEFDAGWNAAAKMAHKAVDAAQPQPREVERESAE